MTVDPFLAGISAEYEWVFQCELAHLLIVHRAQEIAPDKLWWVGLPGGWADLDKTHKEMHDEHPPDHLHLARPPRRLRPQVDLADAIREAVHDR